jgi:hypothetical protein
VPLVKTVYVLLHPPVQAAITAFASQVADLSLADRIQKIREFWGKKFSSQTAAGRAWQELLKLAASDGRPFPYEDLRRGLALRVLKT